MGSEAQTKFRSGDRVLVRADTPAGHHRTPAYIKGRTGQIDTDCGTYYNPESRAYGGSGLPKQRLYRVKFDQTEVWGDSYSGPSNDLIYVDLYEHWLEPA